MSAPDADDTHARDQANFRASLAGLEPYTLGPDSLPQPGVPRGVVTPYHWRSERHFPGTERDYWLSVPAQYDPAQPTCLMVWQDGAFYLRPDVNVPLVFDNLIYQGALPVTLGLFVNPGRRDAEGGEDSEQRSLEYDSLGDTYVRFLLEELLPEVQAHYAVTSDPAGRAMGGMSSGGICAFTAAWERPDAFSKVVSHCGSFTDLRGGHVYPALIRKTPRKPLRVFLQTGARDLDLVMGSWPVANQAMAAALAYRAYDYQFVLGEGGHTLQHGAALLPDTLRWLWRDYPK